MINSYICKGHFGSYKAKRLEIKERVRAGKPVRRLLRSFTKETVEAWAGEVKVRHEQSLVRI